MFERFLKLTLKIFSAECRIHCGAVIISKLQLNRIFCGIQSTADRLYDMMIIRHLIVQIVDSRFRRDQNHILFIRSVLDIDSPQYFKNLIQMLLVNQQRKLVSTVTGYHFILIQSTL